MRSDDIMQEGGCVKYLRVSAVSTFFKSPDYIDYIERTEKRDRTNSMKRAMKIGTRTDQIIKAKENPTKKDAEEVITAHKSYQQFLSNYNPVSVVAGERLFNDELAITGEPDLYFNFQELSDIKVSIETRFEYWVQLGGYLLLPIPYEITRVSILRLDKQGGNYDYQAREGVHELFKLKTLFIGELNKVRAYLEYTNQEDEYDKCYYDRVSGTAD